MKSEYTQDEYKSNWQRFVVKLFLQRIKFLKRKDRKFLNDERILNNIVEYMLRRYATIGGLYKKFKENVVHDFKNIGIVHNEVCIAIILNQGENFCDKDFSSINDKSLCDIKVFRREGKDDEWQMEYACRHYRGFKKC